MPKPKLTVKERLMSKVRVNPETGCWEWTAYCMPNGYGKVRIDTIGLLAHRAMYEASGLEIPLGLELDHTCRVRHCINPEHLEPVTHLENMRRGNSPSSAQREQTHCRQGHPLSGENLYVHDGHRSCRMCRRIRNRGRTRFTLPSGTRVRRAINRVVVAVDVSEERGPTADVVPEVNRLPILPPVVLGEP